MEIQPIDITQIIVAIISTVAVLYSAQKQKLERKQTKPPEPVLPPKITTWIIVICVSIILLIANLGVFGWRYWGSTPTPEVKITYPYDGATVEIREMIRGTSQRIPKGQVIWVAAYLDRYHPQNYPADVQANGDWSSLAFIGIEEDIGKKFDIIAVLADKKAQDTFNAYLIQARDTKTWSGLERLPEGALIYDRITVTRK